MTKIEYKESTRKEQIENNVAFLIKLCVPIAEAVEIGLLYYFAFRFLPLWLACAVFIWRAYAVLGSIFVLISVAFGSKFWENNDPVDEQNGST